MEARASAKYLRGSAQKARLVVDMIRGKRVGEALAILRFTNKRAASRIEKCLRSAIAVASAIAERRHFSIPLAAPVFVNRRMATAPPTPLPLILSSPIPPFFLDPGLPLALA